MVIRKTLDFYKGDNIIKLPFYFHVKDIKQDHFDNEKENIIEDYGYEEFSTQFENNKTKEYNIDLLKFVNLKEFTIGSNNDDELGEYRDKVVKYNGDYIFKDHESLYSFLINFLIFNDVDFKIIDDFVAYSQVRLKMEFRDMLHAELENDSENRKPTESYMVLRCAFELNRPPIFPENTGVNIQDNSWREAITQRAYIGRKSELEKLQYDDIMKENKSKK